MEEKDKITKITLTSPNYHHTIIRGISHGILETSEVKQIIEDLDNGIHH